MVRRGDLHWANPPKLGKHRFLIVQDDSFNRKFDEVLAVPIVSVKREEIHSWEVEVPEGTFPEPSIVNCSAIVLIEKSDLEDFITTLDEKTMQGVDYALSITLGLQDW
ncbi:type II toxin-antitoxin system PemK/MazF family toxin [Candidatus Bipolaricaulota bacterium]|nr:type II toxin-antitoxin system PemK/MazF family toxin [Candidatus Bipolaricaulota bacterium]